MIHHLSVSQVEHFDETQLGGCPTRWWFENVQGLRDEYGEASKDGTAGHALLAHWLKTGEPPAGRTRMGKAATAVIAKGELRPQSNQQVETRFDGQEMYDADGKWIPVDREKTFWLGGYPWDGFVDHRWFDGVIHVRDHKFTADIAAKEASFPSLIQTIQMPVYALEALRVWPDATGFELIHHYVSRKGTESKMRRELVSLPQLQRRGYEIGQLTIRIAKAATATRPEDVPFNRKACSAGYGCPWQSICPAFKERKVQFTADELSLFSSPAKPVATADPVFTTATAVRAPERPPEVAVIPPDAPPNDPNAPTPDEEKAAKAAAKKAEKAAAKEPLIYPDCPACGACLNPENAAKKRGGGFKHIGCTVKEENAIAAKQPVQSSPQTSDIIESGNRPTQATAIPPPPEPTPAPTEEQKELARKLAAKLTEKIQIQRVVIELGPETLAILRALIK